MAGCRKKPHELREQPVAKDLSACACEKRWEPYLETRGSLIGSRRWDSQRRLRWSSVSCHFWKTFLVGTLQKRSARGTLLGLEYTDPGL